MVTAFDAHLGRLGQIRPAHAAAVRAVRHVLSATGTTAANYPPHPAACPACAPTFHRLGLRLAPPWKIIRRRRYRKVPAVAAHDPLQRRDPLDQPRVRRRQLLDRIGLRSEHHVPRRTRLAPQRRRRLGHSGVSTTAPNSDQHDTPTEDHLTPTVTSLDHSLLSQP